LALKSQQVLELLWIHLRHIVVENQIDVRAARVGVGVARIDRSGAAHSANFDVLVPLFLAYRAAVNFEMNEVALDGNGADHGAVAGLNRWTPHGNHRLQFLA
jgi:hypothetical protein